MFETTDPWYGWSTNSIGRNLTNTTNTKVVLLITLPESHPGWCINLRASYSLKMLHRLLNLKFLLTTSGSQHQNQVKSGYQSSVISLLRANWLGSLTVILLAVRLNWPIRTDLHHMRLRSSNSRSLLPTTVLLRTTPTRTIRLHAQTIWN